MKREKLDKFINKWENIARREEREGNKELAKGMRSVLADLYQEERELESDPSE